MTRFRVKDFNFGGTMRRAEWVAEDNCAGRPRRRRRALRLLTSQRSLQCCRSAPTTPSRRCTPPAPRSWSVFSASKALNTDRHQIVLTSDRA